MTTDERQIIAQALANGSAGLQNDYLAASNQQLVQVLVPAYMSRPWLVVLLSQRYSKDQGVGPGLSAQAPPDNQIATTFAGAGITPYLVPGNFVQVQYGNGPVIETVFVDYPFGGGSFVVTGAQVRVQCPTPRTLPSGAQFPRYGAYISECQFRDGSNFNPPTLTVSPQVLIHLAAPLPFYVPPRAVGYRIFNGSNAAPPVGGTITAIQGIWFGGNPLQFQHDSSIDANDLLGPQSLQGATAVTLTGDVGFRPLMPATSVLLLQNNHATLDLSVAVQWLLDLS